MKFNLQKVRGRDGSVKDFDISKIEKAIKKSFEAVRRKGLEEFTKEQHEEFIIGLSKVAATKVVQEMETYPLEFAIDSMIKGSEYFSYETLDKNHIIFGIETIQDLVENVLIDMGEKKAAKAYIRYRQRHEGFRATLSTQLDAVQTIKDYVGEETWETKENANMSYSLQGLNNHIIAKASKTFWLHEVYDEAIRDAHNTGDMHIHDLGLISTYCCGWGLDDLLRKGFGGVADKVESGPAKHFKSALMQVVNFIYTLQGEAAGAQALSNFDTLLAPFIAYDNLSYEQVKSEIQSFVFNVNIATRVGFQTPFFNITMDKEVPNTHSGMPVIIGGKYMDRTYSEFQNEMDMLNRAYCEVMTTGDAKGRIFSFPIPTYNITKDFNFDDEIGQAILKMTARYGIPYFSNFINSDMSPEDVRSMCCRLRLDNNELIRRGGGLFGANPKTGSIGVVTINMARIGYLERTFEGFLARLKRIMDLAKISLEEKRKILEINTSVKNLYPYSKYYLQDVADSNENGEYWFNHFATIGLNGMNEGILNFTNGKENIATPNGKEFAEKVLDYMNKVLIEYQLETGHLYNLEASPAEGTGTRLALLDKSKYSNIITAGENHPYYTNSTQLPVGHTEDIFEAIELQEKLQCAYTGGTVFHGFAGEEIEDLNVLKTLILNVLTRFRIPYFTFSPTFSICPDHGYLKGEQFICPHCNAETTVWTRVVGFHRPVQNWNAGKQEEFKDRKEFTI